MLTSGIFFEEEPDQTNSKSDKKYMTTNISLKIKGKNRDI